MSTKATFTLCALLGLAVPTAPAFAMTGIGCPDLPEYYRAVGTVENGEGSCGMTMAEAKRILARGENGQGPVAQPAAPPAPRKHHRRHKTHHE